MGFSWTAPPDEPLTHQAKLWRLSGRESSRDIARQITLNPVRVGEHLKSILAGDGSQGHAAGFGHAHGECRRCGHGDDDGSADIGGFLHHLDRHAARKHDQAGAPYLVVSGPEPDYRWETFIDELAEVVHEQDVALTLGLGAVPMGVPHTRPAVITMHATRPELLDRVNLWAGARFAQAAELPAAEVVARLRA